RRLGSRAPQVLEIPGLAIEVEDRTGTGGPAASIDLLQSEHFSLGMLFKPNGEALEARVCGCCRPGRIHLPDAERSLGPADGDEHQKEKRSHEGRVRRIGCRSKLQEVVRG